MNRQTKAFARRVWLELVRDPLSYAFALGFPLAMLGIMTVVHRSIPPEAAMTLFVPASLVPGITIFGTTFFTLFTAILVAEDRAGGFLTRLTVSPMRAVDFLGGYLAPLGLLAVVQSVLAYLAGGILALLTDEALPLSGILTAIALSCPSMLFFLALGFVIGNLCGTRAAPGISSILISAVSLLGGIWMDVDAMGGAWLTICQALPFYHAVKLARDAIHGEVALLSLGVVGLWTIAVLLIGCMVFLTREK